MKLQVKIPFFLTFFLSLTSTQIFSQQCEMPGGSHARSTTENCNDIDLESIPVKKIRITIHVFQKDDGSDNIPDNSTGEDWIEDAVDQTNAWMRQMGTYNQNPSASIDDSRIEYDLKNIYFWQNSTMHAKGDNSISNGNSLHSFVKGKSIAYKYSSIHIFIPGNFFGDGDSNQGRACGIGCEKWVILEDVYHRYVNGGSQGKWEVANLMRHELGHCLNLFHTDDDDLCGDTPEAGSNNVMHPDGGSQHALTQCQAGRMHYWLNNDAGAASILQSGHQTSTIAGTISYPGYTASLSCCTQNISNATATINVTSQSGIDISWSKTGGSGSFSSSSGGKVLNLSGLGTISLKATWTENCKDFTQTWTFFNGGYFMMSGPNPTADEYSVELQHEGEWDALLKSLESYDARKGFLDTYELLDQRGYMVKSGETKRGEKELNLSLSGLELGTYYLVLRKGEVRIERKILKL